MSLFLVSKASAKSVRKPPSHFFLLSKMCIKLLYLFDKWVQQLSAWIVILWKFISESETNHSTRNFKYYHTKRSNNTCNLIILVTPKILPSGKISTKVVKENFKIDWIRMNRIFRELLKFHCRMSSSSYPSKLYYTYWIMNRMKRLFGTNMRLGFKTHQKTNYWNKGYCSLLISVMYFMHENT